MQLRNSKSTTSLAENLTYQKRVLINLVVMDDKPTTTWCEASLS